jgi:hypothetical protein
MRLDELTSARLLAPEPEPAVALGLMRLDELISPRLVAPEPERAVVLA